MVQSKSNPRLSRISHAIILAQTDTTVGFISQNKEQLSSIKSRDSAKPFIKIYSSFQTLRLNKHRIPQNKKKLVRRAKKTTFIVKNRAFRIVKDAVKSQISRDLQWNYSTSANARGKKFNFEFCEYKADIIIENKDGLHENTSSTLLKITNTKKVKIR